MPQPLHARSHYESPCQKPYSPIEQRVRHAHKGREEWISGQRGRVRIDFLSREVVPLGVPKELLVRVNTTYSQSFGVQLKKTMVQGMESVYRLFTNGCECNAQRGVRLREGRVTFTHNHFTINYTQSIHSQRKSIQRFRATKLYLEINQKLHQSLQVSHALYIQNHGRLCLDREPLQAFITLYSLSTTAILLVIILWVETVLTHSLSFTFSQWRSASFVISRFRLNHSFFLRLSPCFNRIPGNLAIFVIHFIHMIEAH